MLMVKHFFTLVLLFTIGLLSGQGWERVFGGGGSDAAYSITRAHDGGYVMAGYYGGLTRLYLIKTDADGNHQWEKIVALTKKEFSKNKILRNP